MSSPHTRSGQKLIIIIINYSPRHELQMVKLFQEWKKKNEKRMRELNVRPRVFEYVSKPTVVQQR